MKQKNNSDIIAGLVVLLIGVFIFIESLNLLKIGEYYNSPGLLPVIISVIIVLSSIVLIGSGIKKEFKKENISDKKEQIDITKEPMFNVRIIIVILIITLYIIALSYVHFLTASIPFLFILMCYLKSSNFIKISILSILMPILIQYVFKNLFNQIIP